MLCCLARSQGGNKSLEFEVIFMKIFQSLNRTNWFQPAAGRNVSGCQATCNKLPPMAFKIVSKTVWFICTARSDILIFMMLFIV